ncbi:MAG: fatty acid desaturase family protein [Deltaproteobacteria bacterium]|nr:fatty acid desaturase family protein [Deltaproteobacteria bacterium]
MVNITQLALVTDQDLRLTIKSLSRIAPWRTVYHLTESWLIIVGTILVSIELVPLTLSVGSVLVYLAAVAVISSRQHALMVLTHDGIHKRLSKVLWINDWLARFFAAFPVFISLAKWRFIHLYHHQHTHTAEDPDRAIYARYPLNRQKFRQLLLRDVCGLNVFSTLKYFIDIPLVTAEFNRRFLGQERARQYRQTVDMGAFALFWIVVLGGAVFFGGFTSVLLLVLYWIVPYCTLTQVFFRIRGAIEHGNVPDPANVYRQTRTYFITPLLAFFFAPKQVNYHLEHHLYPSVPFYNLPRLHAVLRDTVYPDEQAYCEAFPVSLRKLAA